MTFRSLSIKRKLMLITMLTSSLALLLASLGFLAYDSMAARARMSHDAEPGAEPAQPLYAFDDRRLGVGLRVRRSQPPSSPRCYACRSPGSSARARHCRRHAADLGLAVDLRAQLGEVAQLLAVQRVGGIEVGEPVLKVGSQIALAPAMTAVAVVAIGETRMLLDSC